MRGVLSFSPTTSGIGFAANRCQSKASTTSRLAFSHDPLRTLPASLTEPQSLLLSVGYASVKRFCSHSTQARIAAASTTILTAASARPSARINPPFLTPHLGHSTGLYPVSPPRYLTSLSVSSRRSNTFDTAPPSPNHSPQHITLVYTALFVCALTSSLLIGIYTSPHLHAAGREGFEPEPAATMTSTGTATPEKIQSGAATPTTSADVAIPPEGKAPDEASKFRTFLGILKKFIGVSDLAAVRFSLPAHLLEPTPNLEYWTYLDSPETFVSIPDSEDPVGRMLGTLRFWFTKDLKYVKGKPVKPYNSTLGEFFRCNWVCQDTQPPLRHPNSAPGSSAASFKSTQSTTAEQPSGQSVKVSFLTEQTSHHPPVSAFWIDCPEKGIIARGYDQLSAKFTGTSIRVVPGNHNLGIFIDLTKRDNEQYQLTHPAASLGGLLRGNLSISVSDSCFATCPKTKLKCILTYVEDGWIGKAQNKVEGVVFRYNPDKDSLMRVKDVPEKDVVARIEGDWKDKVYYTLGSSSFSKADEKILLIDLNPLTPAPKICPPMEQQLPNESRKFWDGVTQAIVTKQYNQATTLKTEIEERQRKKAAERKERDSEWQPRFFTGAVTPVGKPELTQDGELAIRGLHDDNFALSENKELGA